MDFPRSTVELKDDTVIVVLGASGDLAKKKTVCILDMAVLKTKAVQN
jgi:glucose-6-phosphate 1-dehydrogenase